MAEPSGAETSVVSYRKDKKEYKELSSEKVRQIIVWRTEVDYSRTHCICSTPTMLQTSRATPSRSGSEDKDKDEGKGKGKAVDRGGQQTGESSSTAIESDIPEPKDVPVHVGMFIPEGDPCPTCATPVNEGVKFKPVAASGDNAIIWTNASARSTSSLNRLSDVISYRQYQTPPKTWLQRAKKPVQKIKRAVTPDHEKSKRKAVLKPLMGLLRRRSSTGSNSSGPLTVRPRATEMYHTVPDAVPPGAAGSVETLLSGLSDSDDDNHDKRGRPKLTIDDSAARLRRAQRLLEKQKRNPDSKG
ncbi:hypothetical protein F4806DRAFT_351429 [Annulohypoxylon nitens]|nr:hypothetical protein F4806DRAFT_351429 [Annulohypoxylon nitens]